MNKENFRKLLVEAINKYIANEEEYGDNSVVEISPDTLQISLLAEERDEEKYDYYDVMDFLEMSVDNPGKWNVDSDAVEEVVEEYIH